MIWRCDLLKQYEKYRVEVDAAIARVLFSGKYILSDEVARFEKEFANYIGVAHAIAVASGTDALILSLRAVGIRDGDEVITTPFTAIPTISAIVAAGATPVFVDVDQDTFLMDLSKVPSRISKKTKAIVPVHIFGNVVDVEKMRRSIPKSIAIIEDACQAHGSAIRGKRAGSLGDLGAFSFYPTKNLGAYGDGGMITTNSAKSAEKIGLMRMYGMVDKDRIIIHGINSRLDELQASILRVKLKYLDEMNMRRKEIADYYKGTLPQRIFQHQKISNDVQANYHVFVSRFKGDRRKLISFLNDRGIQTNVYYPLPQYLQKANRYLGYRRGDFPKADRICGEVIALPMYPEFEKRLQDRVVKTINRFCTRGTRDRR